MHKNGINDQSDQYDILVKKYDDLKRRFELYKEKIETIHTKDLSYFSNRNICLQKKIEKMLGRNLRMRVVDGANVMIIDIADLHVFFRRSYSNLELSVDASSLLLDGDSLGELLDGGKEYELTVRLIDLEEISKRRDANSLIDA